jgi:hypothetical protein
VWRKRIDRAFAWLGNTGGPPGWMIQTAQGVVVIVIWIAAALFGVESARRFWQESGSIVTAYVTATFGLWQVARRWKQPGKEDA